MPTLANIKEIVLSTNGTISYQPVDTDGFSVYVITGSGTMLASAAISINGSLTLAMKKTFVYTGTFALNGNDISIQSVNLTSEQAAGGNTIIECTKPKNGSWIASFLNSSTIEPKRVEGTKTTVLTGAGAAPVVLDPATDYQTQILTGSGALSGSYDYTATGNQNGDFFRVIYNGSFSATGGDITIFGIQLTDEQVLNGGVVIEAEYNGSSYVTSMYMSPNTIFAGLPELVTKEISFADGECGTNAMQFPYDCELYYIQFYVTAPIADTYDVEILKNATSLEILHFDTLDLLNQGVNSLPFFESFGAFGDILSISVTSTGGGGGGRLNAQIYITRN